MLMVAAFLLARRSGKTHVLRIRAESAQSPQGAFRLSLLLAGAIAAIALWAGLVQMWQTLLPQLMPGLACSQHLAFWPACTFASISSPLSPWTAVAALALSGAAWAAGHVLARSHPAYPAVAFLLATLMFAATIDVIGLTAGDGAPISLSALFTSYLAAVIASLSASALVLALARGKFAPVLLGCVVLAMVLAFELSAFLTLASLLPLLPPATGIAAIGLALMLPAVSATGFIVATASGASEAGT